MNKGYTVYKQYSGIRLIQNGFESYSTKGNTQLGKLIKSARLELKKDIKIPFVTWYHVDDLKTGAVSIIYKTI